jgi:uncharacterized protein
VPARLISLYSVAIVLAELILVFVGILPGALCHALLVLVLGGRFVLSSQSEQSDEMGRADVASLDRASMVLALVPLLRVLSVALPLRVIPPIYWLAVVGVALAVAIVLAARRLGFSSADLGLRLDGWPWQVILASSGLPLGAAGYLILRPTPPVDPANWRAAVVATLILIVCGGFAEELLFRGILRRSLEEVVPGGSLALCSLLFGALYVGSGTPIFAVWAAAVGLFFGWCASRTQSILGVALAHALLVVGMAFLWRPAIISFRRMISTMDAQIVVLVWPGLTLGILVWLVVVVIGIRRAPIVGGHPVASGQE